MTNPQLLDYIKQQLAQGITRDTIQNNLMTSGGWAMSDIQEAFAAIPNASVATASAMTTPQQNPIPNQMTNTAPSPMVGVKYAGFWVRFVAMMVDTLIISIPFFVLAIFAAGDGVPTPSSQFVTNSISLLVSIIYYCLFTYFKGATLGKMLVGIEVKNENLQKLSFGRVLLREVIGKIISGIIFGVGYIIAAFTQKKQALHDKVASSVVVYRDPAKRHTVGLIIGIIIVVVFPLLAIIGMASSFVLVGLSSARSKAGDATTKSYVYSIRANAEIYYMKNNSSYSTSQNCNSGMFADRDIQANLSKVPQSDLTCYAEGQSYAVSVKLSEAGKNFCIDNTGRTTDTIAIDSNGQASCQVTGSNNNPTPTQPTTINTNKTMPAWNAKIVGGTLTDTEKADIVAGTMKVIDILNSGDVAQFRKIMSAIAPPDQLSQLEKATDAQLLQTMAFLGPIMSQGITPETLYSSKATWTIKDKNTVQIKIQIDKNTSQSVTATRVNGVWY